LGSLVDVAAVQLAGGTAALRFGLCTPASLAETTATVTAPRPAGGTGGGGAASSNPLSLTRAGVLPAVYHSALQLELWLYALLERAMPPRLARLQRLTPPDDSVLLQGPMERRDSGGLLGATHHRNLYVVAGNLLYEYRGAGGSGAHPPLQATAATLHMIVPLVGLRVSLASEAVLRVSGARPGGEGFTVVKSTYTGPPEGGPVIEHQSLAASKKEELTLVAPDGVAAREWLVVFSHAMVDKLTPEPRGGGRSSAKAPAGPLPEGALPPPGKAKSPTAAALKPLKSLAGSLLSGATGGGGSSGSRSPRRGGAAPPPTSQRALTDPRRRRSCQLYVPFEPEVTLGEAEALARAIAQTQGLAATGAMV
jgi:hypothetical protein